MTNIRNVYAKMHAHLLPYKSIDSNVFLAFFVKIRSKTLTQARCETDSKTWLEDFCEVVECLCKMKPTIQRVGRQRSLSQELL